MTCRRAFVVVLATWLLAAAGTWAQAAEDILSVIPEDALGFAVVNRLAETDAKVQALGRQMQLPVPSLLGKVKTSTGVQKGLDEKGSSAVVVLPAKDDGARPVGLLFVPVSDFGEFVGQLKPEDADAKIVRVVVMDSPFLVAHKAGYAVFAEPRHRDALKRILDAPGRLPAELAPWRAWLTENDAAGVLTRRGIEMLCTKGQEGLRQAKASFEAMDVPEEMQGNIQAAIAMFDIYGNMLKAIGEEVQTYAFAARVDEQGNVYVIDRTRLTPGGQLAKMLGEIKPAEGDLLAGLPGGPFVLAGAGPLPKTLGDAMVDFSVDVMKAMPKLYGVTEEQAEQLAKLSTKYMRGLDGMSLVMGVGKPGGSLYDKMVVVMKVDNAKRFMADYERSIVQMNELVKDAEGSIFRGMGVRQIQIDGTTALEIATKVPKTPAMKDIPNYDKMMEAFFGPGGELLAYAAPADEHTIVATYTSKRGLVKCLKLVKQAKASLSGNRGVAKTAALLPADAQWVAYWSPRGTVGLINRLIPAMAPDPDDVIKLPEFPRTPPVGLAVKAAGDELHGYMVVPAAIVKAVGRYVPEVQKAIIRQVQQELKSLEEL